MNQRGSSTSREPAGSTDPRVRYSLEVLLGKDAAAEAPVVYGDTVSHAAAEAVVHVIPSGFFEGKYGTAGSLPKLPLKDVEGVPLLFGDPEVVRHGSRLVVRGDIIASAYFLLTRYEEWIRRDVRDVHGRFPGRESLPCRAGFIDRPIVDEYGDLLRKWAGEVGIQLPAPKRRFSVLLTHDVDHIRTRRSPLQALRSVASGLCGRQPWKSAMGRAGAALGLTDDPLNNLDDVIRLDRRLTDHRPGDRCQSVYFFMAGGQSGFDRNYDVRSPAARDVIRRVLASGASVGLHASYEAGRRPELVARELATLNEVAEVPIRMNRYHYLGWREPEDGHALAAAGITWDSTLGYADTAGFRLGVCHAVPLFDPVGNCPLGIEEHPLMVMDVTLADEPYMKLDEEAAFDCVCRLARTTFQHQGEFVMLWHNDRLAWPHPGYERSLYPRVLDNLDELLGADPHQPFPST